MPPVQSGNPKQKHFDATALFGALKAAGLPVRPVPATLSKPNMEITVVHVLPHTPFEAGLGFAPFT